MSVVRKQRREQCQLPAKLSENKDVNSVSCQQTKMWTMSAVSKDVNTISCQQTKMWRMSAVSKQRREQSQLPANKDANSVSCQQAKTWTVSVASKQRREQCQCGLEIPEQGGRYSSPLPSPSHTNSTNKDMNSLRLYKYLDGVLDVQIYRSPSPLPPPPSSPCSPPPPPPPITHTHCIHCQERHGYSVSRIDKYQDEVVALRL